MDARVTEFALATAKAKLSELVERASHGEEITISRHGKVVAKLVGVTDEAAERQRRQPEHEPCYHRGVTKGGPPRRGSQHHV